MAVLFSETRCVLVCVDGSLGCSKAFDWFLEHAYQKHDEIGLVHIHIPPNLNTISRDRKMEGYINKIQKSISESKEVIEHYKEKCRKRGIFCKVFLETLQNSVGQSICEIAVQNNVSLIVIGQRGLSKLRRTVFGSVSHYVLTHSKIPTMVIPSSCFETPDHGQTV